jgi:glycine dehydrogenase subunit 2
VTEALADFLPVPLVTFDGERYALEYDVPLTIGKTRTFHGVFPVILKAYAWMLSLGAEGLREVAKIAVLNNNYLLHRITQLRGAASPFTAGKHRIEQVRYTWEQLTQDTGVTTEDVTCRMADFGFHLWASHHPFIVPQPFTIEPTESYSLDELDEYLEGLERVVEESYTDPEMVKSAPYQSVVHKIDQSTFDDPEKWAITWRAYLKKSGLKEKDDEQ